MTENRTPDQVARDLTKYANRIESWTQSRDIAIRKLAGAGWSLREIAEVAGLSHTGVKKILERGAK